jgi:hypothetical protein
VKKCEFEELVDTTVPPNYEGLLHPCMVPPSSFSCIVLRASNFCRSILDQLRCSSKTACSCIQTKRAVKKLFNLTCNPKYCWRLKCPNYGLNLNANRFSHVLQKQKVFWTISGAQTKRAMNNSSSQKEQLEVETRNNLWIIGWSKNCFPWPPVQKTNSYRFRIFIGLWEN